MMNKKQLLESNKECADMLGMTLKEYTNYLKNVKINNNNESQQMHNKDFLNFLGIKKENLKLKKV